MYMIICISLQNRMGTHQCIYACIYACTDFVYTYVYVTYTHDYIYTLRHVWMQKRHKYKHLLYIVKVE